MFNPTELPELWEGKKYFLFQFARKFKGVHIVPCNEDTYNKFIPISTNPSTIFLAEFDATF